MPRALAADSRGLCDEVLQCKRHCSIDKFNDCFEDANSRGQRSEVADMSRSHHRREPVSLSPIDSCLSSTVARRGNERTNSFGSVTTLCKRDLLDLKIERLQHFESFVRDFDTPLL